MLTGELTVRTVMFWSRKNKMERNTAGSAASNRYFKGRESKGTRSGRPIVIAPVGRARRGTSASKRTARDALNALRATAFRGVVVHVETRLRDRAGPYAKRMEAALRVILGDERVDDSLRRAEASRRGWVTLRAGEA